MTYVAGRASGRNSIFEQWQPEYASRGIATFPVHETKRPAIRGWQKVGLKASAVLAGKKAADAFGYVTGRRAKITVLDIDTPDERVSEDAIGRHGQPGIIVRTASGKRHHLYGYNGEGRRIRPWPDLPIDVLGDNGYVLAPPSKLERGSYEIIHGHLDDLDRLKPMVGADALPSAPPLQGMREHDGRNHALFMALGPIARNVQQANGTRDQLLDIARKHNAQCAQPMEDKEVNQIVDNIWRMTREGRNVIGMPEAFCLTLDHLNIDDPYAFKLLAFLRANQGPHAMFMCTNTLAERFGWDRRRLAAARSRLIELGYIKPQRQAGRGHPALFKWTKY